MNKRLLLYACVLAFLLWLVNTLANAFYWYSAIWWFDIPMHIFGGFFLSFLVGSFFFQKLSVLRKREVTISVLLMVLLLGFGWEIFEYTVQYLIKGAQLANIPDSVKDMLMDLIGGLCAVPFVLRALSLYNRAHVKGNQHN